MQRQKIKIQGDSKTIVALAECVDIMNKKPKYDFEYTIENDELQQNATITITAPDPFHFYILGAFSYDVYQKIFEKEKS